MNYVPSSKPIPLKNRRLNSIIKAELFYEKGFFIVIPGNISLNNSDLKGCMVMASSQENDFVSWYFL